MNYIGDSIKENSILKFENSKTKEIPYYLYSESMLYKYDNRGEIDKKGLLNIKVDQSLTLINDEHRNWSLIGSVDEVYSKIFK